MTIFMPIYIIVKKRKILGNYFPFILIKGTCNQIYFWLVENQISILLETYLISGILDFLGIHLAVFASSSRWKSSGFFKSFKTGFSFPSSDTLNFNSTSLVASTYNVVFPEIRGVSFSIKKKNPQFLFKYQTFSVWLSCIHSFWNVINIDVNLWLQHRI